MLSEHWQYALLLLVIVFVAGVRIRLLSFPLERDEGEYSYAGQLILQGIPPYQLAYNMKLPGTYFAYALILFLFGQTPAGVHLGLLFANVGACLLLFLLAKRLFGATAGAASCAFYGLLSLSPAVLGFAGHATHFVVLPALAGLWLLLTAIDSKKLWQFFGSGFLLGLGFLAKQPGAFFVLFGGLHLLKSQWTRPPQRRPLVSRVGMFVLGAAMPFALTCLILYRAGVLAKFWFWTFSYAREYGSITSFDEGLKNLSHALPNLTFSSLGVWILAAAGLCCVLLVRKLRTHAPFTIGFLVFSSLAVSAGFYFRPHYFVLMLPAVALLAGVAWGSLAEGLWRARTYNVVKAVPAFVLLMALGFSIFYWRDYLFFVDPTRACRLVYGLAPFPEALPVGEYIRNHSPEGARVAVLGSEPEIYFYSHRHSATGYIYMYALLEEQRFAGAMQDEMFKEIESVQPEFIVIINGPSYWGVQRGLEALIFAWGGTYVMQHYDLVGVVDVSPASKYYWGSTAKNVVLSSPMFVKVYKKKQ